MTNVGDEQLWAAVAEPGRRLLDAEVVTQRRDGREVRYTVQPERLEAAARAMSAVAAAVGRTAASDQAHRRGPRIGTSRTAVPRSSSTTRCGHLSRQRITPTE